MLLFEVVKKEGRKVEAYELGKPLPKEIESKIKKNGEEYEIFSKEARNKGEIAKKGDFIKADSSGDIYPNNRDWFLKNHRKVEENCYEQIPKPLSAWKYSPEETLPKEIEFLVKKKGLEIDEKSMKAPLWGTVEETPISSVIIFYDISYSNGDIVDADFNFVEIGEFERTYNVIGK